MLYLTKIGRGGNRWKIRGDGSIYVFTKGEEGKSVNYQTVRLGSDGRLSY